MWGEAVWGGGRVGPVGRERGRCCTFPQQKSAAATLQFVAASEHHWDTKPAACQHIGSARRSVPCN